MKTLLLVCLAAWASGKPHFSSNNGLNKNTIANRPIPQTQVIGGSDAQPGQYPWQVSLQRRSSTGQLSHSCGGTMVDPIHVVSAAHCVNGVTDMSTLSVVVGAHNINDPTESTQQRRGVTKYTKHEKFSEIDFSNDISVITLDSRVECNDRLHSLPIAHYALDNNVEPSGTCVFTGWGNSSSTGCSPVVTPILLFKTSI